MTLNVSTQVLDGAPRDAVERVSGTLFTRVHKPGEDASGSAAELASPLCRCSVSGLGSAIMR